MEITTDTLSSALTAEEPVNASWFSALGSEATSWINAPINSGINLLDKMAKGAKELAASIRNGTFGSIFKQWAKDDPIAAGAGTIAAGLAASVVLIVGGSAIGAVMGSVGGAVGKLGVLGTIGTLGGLGSITGSVLNGAETVYSIDWQQSDEDIMKEINDAIDNLYEPAGEFMGRQLAGVLVGGATAAPKARINVKMAAYAWALNPDIRDDLISNISEFAYVGMTAFTQIAIKYAMLKGRQGLKAFAKKNPGLINKISPKLAKAIETWGENGKEPWSIESEVNEQIETIDNDRIQSAVEGFISGFWQQFRSSVEYVYN
jgi:hypothetical protein